MSAYADESDMYNLGIPETVLLGFPPDQRTAAIEAFSSEMDGYLPPRYKPPFTIPLASLPKAMRMHCARGAVYLLMSGRGMNPSAAGNALIIKGYDDALTWLRNVARGIITLPRTDEGEPVPVAAPACSSEPSRWSEV